MTTEQSAALLNPDPYEVDETPPGRPNNKRTRTDATPISHEELTHLVMRLQSHSLDQERTIADLASRVSEYHCDLAGYDLIGRYCYLVQDDPNAVKSNLVDQQNACAHVGGNLPCFDDDADQPRLTNYLTSKRGPDFEPVFIGLRCDLSSGHWAWVDPLFFYDADVACFEDESIDPFYCDASDFGKSFMLTSNSTWREFTTFPPSFQPSLAVCQRVGIPIDIDPTSTESTPGKQYDDSPLIIGLGCALIILIYYVILGVIRIRKQNKKLLAQKTLKSAEEGGSRKETTHKVDDIYEIDRGCINILFSAKLGTGAFGIVYIGRMEPETISRKGSMSLVQKSALKLNDGMVAVKMLHEYADKLAEFEFLEEISIMKAIGHHERLVNIIACVTASTPVLLITEYCNEGDLLAFMKRRREIMMGISAETDLSDMVKSNLITQEQQLQFAVQIAYGMEYLSSRGFIHRDLAARNILVDSKNGCKIGDFGLCRRVNAEQELYLSRGGRLPIKWMAPEALRRYEMSVASDVWSFGILLFEIITLGGSPYPHWEPADILLRLESGERMERPDNCSDSVFSVMRDCWLTDPALRPSFTDLRCRIAKALEESPSEYYLQLDGSRDYYMVARDKDLPILEDAIKRRD